MRPTTKDLAKAAGVSLATVDRVLNGRSGVSAKTVTAVNNAIETIDFERNQLAATLARKRGYKFGFVLPKQGDEFLKEIVDRITEFDEAGRAEMISVKSLRVDELDPHKTVRSLSRIRAEEFDGIAIMAPETPQIRDAIRRMRERGIKTIPFVANQQGEASDTFVGIENRAAGETAGRLMGRFSCGNAGSIAVIAETMQSSASLQRRLGFDSVINNNFSHLAVLPSLETYANADRAHQIVKTALNAHSNLVGIYVMGSEARMPLHALEKAGMSHQLITIAHERTPTTVASLKDGRIDAVVTQDPGHLVRSAVRILRAKCENRATLASQEKIRIEILLAENL